MRYTHHLKVIRHRRHALPISIISILLVSGLIFVYGFSRLNAEEFLAGFSLSMSRVLMAYGASLLLAIIVSLLVTRNKKIEDLTIPILDVIQSVPSFAILPLLLTYLGNSEVVILILLIMAMIWPILFSLVTAIKSITPELNESAEIFGATGMKKLLYVTFPLIYPAIITGSIVAWGEAWETLLAAELIVRTTGLGTYLLSAGNPNQNSTQIIGILLLMIILFILNKFIWIPLLNQSTKYK